MNHRKNKKILLDLLKCQTSEELEKIIQKERLDKEAWIPYGGRSNNVGTVEGQMREAENALMEKVTNSIDAILMRRCYEEGIDPYDKSVAPKTVDEAVERFFGGREKIREKRSEFAKEWLRITAEGKKDRPTITIVDKGEGQEPNMIKKTILSLNENTKERIPFVYGTYNQGGSSPLGFAGAPEKYDFNYLQLVLCRSSLKNGDKKDGNHDHFGFTVVRMRFDESSEKYVYEYLVEKDTENIFSFPMDEVIKIDDYKFEEGCVIKLYDYQLAKGGNIIFRGFNEFIEKKLPNSPLPIYLKELRNYKGDDNYTIFGLKEKLIRRKDILRSGYPQALPIDLGEIGKKEINLFILKHKAEAEGGEIKSYLDMSERVFFIKDGLVLHAETKSWLKNECGLIDLSPYVIAFIDISTISPAVAKMLHSGREKFKNNATTKTTLNRLKVFFSGEDFKDLDKEYGRLGLNSDTKIEDRDIKKAILKEVENQPKLKELFNIGVDFPVKKGQTYTPPKIDSKYQGTYLPEKFNLLGTNPREIEENSYCRISFDTGADTDLFERQEDRGEYDWEKSENFDITFLSFRNGITTFRVDPKEKTKPPEEEALIFSLSVPSKDIELTRTINILYKEKVPYNGKRFPTFFKPPEEVKIVIGKKTSLRIKTDADNDYISRDEAPGTIIFKKHNDLDNSTPKLKDGILSIQMQYTGKEIKKVENIDITVKDREKHFDFSLPVKIIRDKNNPEVDLPEIEVVDKTKWQHHTPEWDQEVIARIPSWTELKKIRINTDSDPFEDLREIPGEQREIAKTLLIKKIYRDSIWMFLEFRDLNLTSDSDRDERDIVFEKSIRAASKITIQDIKKLIR
ncbi:MAG: hypothetical protein OXB96_02370 [Candidatus Kaiserbacteria bacterium]|nr:hypothetical protein [Candidatus Kaiserbacteria bacterium]